MTIITYSLQQKIFYCSHTVSELTWPAVNNILGNGKECSNILGLIDLILALPASSAMCERGFSLMKQTKTDYRNRLHTKTLSSLLTVKLHAKDETEYDPTPAIHYWNQSGHSQRRVNYMEDRRELLDVPGAEGENQANQEDPQAEVDDHCATTENTGHLQQNDYDSGCDSDELEEEEEEDSSVMTLEEVCADLDFDF